VDAWKTHEGRNRSAAPDLLHGWSCSLRPSVAAATFDGDAGHVRLGGDDGSVYDVVFPEGSFVEMIERTGMRPTETLVRVWLGTVYFDPHVYPWAHRAGLSEIASHGESGASR